MALKIPNSSIETLLKTPQAELQRQFEQLPAVRLQKTMRALFGPLEEIRQAGHLDFAHQFRDQFRELEWGQSLRRAAKEQLYLPRAAEVEKMLREHESSIAMTLQRYQEPMSNLKRAIESMRTPWIDMQNELQSLKGFATLQGIGHALRTMPPFGTSIADALRADLGDWRNEIAWPSEIFIDPEARTSFYEERGLSPTLTAFLDDAFEQGTIIDNINVPASPVPVSQACNSGNERAYNLIYCLETHIREYISARMEAAFSVNWIENQVPKEIRQRWLSKREKAQQNGEREYPLIAYAAFTDYVKIITHEDNWENTFESTFNRKDYVRESFQRIYPIRNAVMHSKELIKSDDELYLYVEVKRILEAIGIRVYPGYKFLLS